MGCIVELALEFSEQNFLIPCSAVAFDNSPRANIGVSFRAIIADPDIHCGMEGANSRRPCCLQRVPDNRWQIILCVSIHDITHYDLAPWRTLRACCEASIQWTRPGGRDLVRASDKSRNSSGAARQMLVVDARSKKQTCFDLTQCVG
jgi:hypothetical protein